MNILKGTKAEVLKKMQEARFPVPKNMYFNVTNWKKNSEEIISIIQTNFKNKKLAIRSSSQSEDTSEDSMAGAFDSFLNICSNNLNDIKKAINNVIDSFDNNSENQVLIQTMVENVAMSGVVMTKVLDDGSPYYVINFDDSTGKTDTVTSGSDINKTVFIYNGVKDEYFDSPYLKMVLKLVREIEENIPNTPMDIEFAIDKNNKAYLLQVRKITTVSTWDEKVNNLVSSRMSFLEDYIHRLMERRTGIYGSKTLLGIMPDWNPAEMIGVVPNPLSMSLYRKLITKSSWRLAREKMGYRKLPNVELMVSLFGRAFIDIRNSINSFLPENVNSEINEKMTNAYIDRLENNPHLHDKIEFEIVFTAYDFSFDKNFNQRYFDVLSREEFLQYKVAIRDITKKAIENSPNSSLNQALKKIDILEKKQNSNSHLSLLNNSFAISDHVNTLLSECIEYGTIPFSIIARHGFIAETLMRSAVSNGAISLSRIEAFKESIKTIASEMSRDYKNVISNKLSIKKFNVKYGHLRPSSYDILSPSYKRRKNLFAGKPQKQSKTGRFSLNKKERKNINIMLLEHGFNSTNADDLFVHARKSIMGREHAKFIFTKHLSDIIEFIADWGKSIKLNRSDISMLMLSDINRVLLSPLTDRTKKYYRNKIKKSKLDLKLASSFKLSYLIRSVKDIYIAPIQRSVANYVGNKRIEKSIVILSPYQSDELVLEDKIVCIEGADPGYDWIFTRNISGLITKYGGANSHMAIRCAEYGIPAAIGCGEQPFDKIIKAKGVILDCKGEKIEPIYY
jgi:glutamine kinase